VGQLREPDVFAGVDRGVLREGGRHGWYKIRDENDKLQLLLKPNRTDEITVAQLPGFDEIIDARSESEYAEDHIPGAISCPVLDDAERIRVGTLYKQSSFDAKKLGAALVARNIARHLEQRFADRPRGWRPAVYCWRGGTRSGAFATVLRSIGWKAGQLDGGYRTYRRAVIADLEILPARYDFRVVCGLTGTGKSLLLQALAAAGAQVLDLEALAEHRGSVLGNLPGAPQPSQKMFDSRVWAALHGFDPQRPVFVESESRKIGLLRVPERLIERMWESACLRVEASLPVRVTILKREYAHFLTDPALLGRQLDCLKNLYGGETIADWKALAHAHDWDTLVPLLLTAHYDPAYTRSIGKNYPRHATAPAVAVAGAGDEAFTQACRDALQAAA
jgi:tRNA 2-selenouridine synthase